MHLWGRITLLGPRLQLYQVNKSRVISIFPDFNLLFKKKKTRHSVLFCLTAGQQQSSQQASSVLPGVVHRPQVQQISNNIVTLSNVQSPALYSSRDQKEPKFPNSQSPQDGSLAAIAKVPKKGNG